MNVSLQQHNEIWLGRAKAFAVAITPLVVAYIGARVAMATTERETNVKFVEVAVSVLQARKDDTTAATNALRGWAVDVLAKKSPVPLSPELRRAFVRGTVRLPGEIAWSSSDSNVVVVSPEGVVTALRPGSATIGACMGGACSGVPVIVTAPGDSVAHRGTVTIGPYDTLRALRVPKP